MPLFLAFLLLCFPLGSVRAGEIDVIRKAAEHAIVALNGKDRSALRAATWPDGHHTIIRHDKGAKPLRRLWEDVPFSGTGVNVREQLENPTISKEGDSALVVIPYTFQLFHGIEETGQHGEGSYRLDLHRRRGEWRVLDMTNVIDVWSREDEPATMQGSKQR